MHKGKITRADNTSLPTQTVLGNTQYVRERREKKENKKIP